MAEMRIVVRLAVRILVGAMTDWVQMKGVRPLLNGMSHLDRLSQRKYAKRKQQNEHRSSQTSFA